MKRITLCGIFALSLLSLNAQSAEWTLDATHTNVDFTIRHLFSKVSGSFKDFSGTFSFDPAKPEASQGTFTVKAASIHTGNEKRDGHLRSPDFFDVEKFPTATFVTKKFEKKGKNAFKMSGDLTIHGITKSVSFETEFLGSDKDPWGTTKSGFVATTRINRKDYGLVWNKTLDSGKFLLGDEVELKIQVEADAAK